MSTQSPRFTKRQAAALFKAADEKGRAAAEEVVPVPMAVVERENPLDDTSPVVRRYAPVEGGVCGFAWVYVVPGGSSFARWLRATRRGRNDSYAGGTAISVFRYGQSLERKTAYAAAFAEVLRDAGIRAYADSRMD